MVTSVDKLLAHSICDALLSNQAPHDFTDNGGMAAHSVTGWVNSCAVFIYGDYGRSFPLRRKSTSLSREVECLPIVLRYLPNYCKDG